MGDAQYLALLDDLAAEEAALDAVVAAIDDDRAAAPTAAPGWDVRDTIDHLAGAEALAAAVITAPGSFAGLLSRPGEPAQARPWTDVLDRWRVERNRVLAGLATAGPRDRFPWVAGDMSAMSFATARLMETWAHGVDAARALGVAYPETARLRHVADLGVRTRAFAFAAHEMAVPDGDVRVEIVGPEGARWTWGSSDVDVVRGSALEFCLVVTQRRHFDDSGLAVQGAIAREWMAVAQAFAGAPTTARRA